jgi:predicted RNase H-like HicB family nuclease
MPRAQLIPLDLLSQAAGARIRRVTYAGSMRYWVVYEQGDDRSWSAYIPDLPGCVAAAKKRSDVERLIREAMVGHLEVMIEHGEGVPRPAPAPWAEEVEVAVPSLPA